MRLRAIALACALASLARAAAPGSPLVHAHAHNDYEHRRPLFEALEQGFCSVEADVHLVDGRLLVAHDLKDAKPGRTLEALYLDPLRQRIRANGGRVYRGGPSVTLLVDVKSDAALTYAALHAVLGHYVDILTVYRGAQSEPGAIAVIVSGARAPDVLAAQSVRYAALDGRPEDLDANPPASLVPWISTNWNLRFTWRWTGAMPDNVRAALGELVARVHAQGRQLRFWNTPDNPAAWRELRAAGVDWIGADDLAGLGNFLRE